MTNSFVLFIAYISTSTIGGIQLIKTRAGQRRNDEPRIGNHYCNGMASVDFVNCYGKLELKM